MNVLWRELDSMATLLDTHWKFLLDLFKKGAIESNFFDVRFHFMYERVMKVSHKYENSWKTLYSWSEKSCFIWDIMLPHPGQIASEEWDKEWEWVCFASATVCLAWMWLFCFARVCVCACCEHYALCVCIYRFLLCIIIVEKRQVKEGSVKRDNCIKLRKGFTARYLTKQILYCWCRVLPLNALCLVML